MKYSQLVHEFMIQQKTIDPDYYSEVCKKYPVLSKQEQQSIREHEISLDVLERPLDEEEL